MFQTRTGWAARHPWAGWARADGVGGPAWRGWTARLGTVTRPGSEPRPGPARRGPPAPRPVPKGRPILPVRCRSPVPPLPSRPSSSRSSCRPSASTVPSTSPSAPSRGARRIPGFRPGKAPRPVLERHLGPGVVLDEAVDHLMQDAYREALVKEDILPLVERRRRGRPGRGGQAAHLQGDGPGPPGGDARRLQGLQLQARDRDDR